MAYNFSSTLALLLVVLCISVPVINGFKFSRSERALVDDAQQSLSTLIKVVTQEIDRSTKVVQKNIDDLAAFGKTSLTTALTILQSSVDADLKQIDDVVKDAELHGLDATECVGNYQELYKNSVDQVLSYMTGLVNGNVTNSTTTGKEAIDQIKSLTKTVDTLTTKLSGCAIGIPGFLCYMEVITEAVKQSAAIPKKIASLQVKATNDIDGIKNLIVESTFTVVAESQTILAKVTQQMITCVTNLTSEPNPRVFKFNK